jgi:hypothetical protein
MSGSFRLLYLFIRSVIKQIVVIMEAHHFVIYIQNFTQHSAVKVNSICRGNYLGPWMWISTQKVSYWSFNLRSSNTWGKKGNRRSSASAFIDCKEAYDSVRREVLYNILIEFVTLMKLVRVIKMRLNET